MTCCCTWQVEEAKDDTVTPAAVTDAAVTDAAVTDAAVTNDDAAAAATDTMIASDVRGVKRYSSVTIRSYHTTVAIVCPACSYYRRRV
jgi:hypothetical protein